MYSSTRVVWLDAISKKLGSSTAVPPMFLLIFNPPNIERFFNFLVGNDADNQFNIRFLMLGLLFTKFTQ